jgi:glycosyltransferase involved in cell wall biosynthesis
VRLVRNPVNRGPGFSRTEGVRASTGAVLFFLDADDIFYPNHVHCCLTELLADDSLGYVFTRMKIDMPMHPDWPPSLDESCPINFCVRRAWHDMIQGFAEEDDFRTYRTEDTLYRMCLRDLVHHRKIDVETCEQFISPGNALDRQKQKLGMSMDEWNKSGLDDGFVLTAQMEGVVNARLAYIAKLQGAKV